jgi:2-aminoethylphosphonate-pyruvate transaminase
MKMRAVKLLFTPGPLTTSSSVKEAMLRDAGSRDPEFIAAVREIRSRLLSLAGAEDAGYEAVPMQGSGTFGIESVIGSAIPRDGKLLVLINGAYGRRMAQIAQVLGIDMVQVSVSEDQPITQAMARSALAANPGVTHAGVVHCETTTGILNPIQEIGEVVRSSGCRYIVDAMSSFGGIPLSVRDCFIDFLVSSANKCIQGVPGFSFAIVRRGALQECEGRARSLSLDLHAQWKGLESDGQFRFTPPTHAVLAFRQALSELEAEGGIAGRAARYAENHRALMQGMTRLGFEAYLAPELQSHIITSFRYPRHAAFEFSHFYGLLSERGFAIYPGKLSNADCFRIGTIGHIFPADIEALVDVIGDVLGEMGLNGRQH